MIKITGDELIALGYKPGKQIGLAIKAGKLYYHKEAALDLLKDILANPKEYLDDSYISIVRELAEELTKKPPVVKTYNFIPKSFPVWGEHLTNSGAIEQMVRAMSLPIVVRGALMPDAHLGYGLPIGGVLATYKAVVPFAVGYDIACRMRLTIIDFPGKTITTHSQSYLNALNACTRFGKGAEWEIDQIPDHPILYDHGWLETRLLKNLSANKLAKQLGTSGSGNHFVDIGILELPMYNNFNLPSGSYVAIMSHSGSRGTGHAIAEEFIKVAKKEVKLEGDLRDMAWLELDTQAGQDYWFAMQMAGEYAKANHEVIHENLVKYLNAEVLGTVENHHNYAWVENDLIVHRKGATPAGLGVMGIIPGSMATSGYLVEGLGNESSLNSASHGAGRAMGRNVAHKTLNKDTMYDILHDCDVKLIGGGIDESPEVYKDIDEVMDAQRDLVKVVGEFKPKIVKMARENETEDI